jgi:hypothetical protein
MFRGIIFFEHGLLSIRKYVERHLLFILTNCSPVDWGIKSRLGQKLASFELPHINRLLDGMTFFEHTHNYVLKLLMASY